MIPKENKLKKSKWWVSKSDLAEENKKCIEKRFAPMPDLKSKAFFWE